MDNKNLNISNEVNSLSNNDSFKENSNANNINEPENITNHEHSKSAKNMTDKKKMIRYQYKAVFENKSVSNYMDAESIQEVESFLLSKGFKNIKIKEDKMSTKLGISSLSVPKKMNAKDLNFFLTQLSTYVKSGIPLVDAMEILSRQVKNKNRQILYHKIVFELNKGSTFSYCLEKQGNVFPKMLINMVKTSEMTGDLTGVLDDMSIYYKQQDTNRKQIINAMIYPSVLLIFAITVLTFVITFVVPSFTKMYKDAGAELPLITKNIISLSDFLINYWVFIIIIFLFFIFMTRMLYKTNKKARYFMQYMVMHVPVVSDILIYNQLITFTGTFATLVKHDVFITDSMDILNRITDNEIYKEIIKDAINNLSSGNGVSIAFKGKWAFPVTAYEMLVTGERTGRLGEMLQHVAEFYQEEQTSLVTRLKSLIEPIMIIVLAVLVGVILLAVVVPMFDIYSNLL